MPEDVEAALFLSVLRGIPFMRALLDRGSIREHELERELERGGEIAVRDVEIERTLYVRLPEGMCRRFAAVPVRYEAGENLAEIAAADPFDSHIAVEFTYHLRMPVCILRAPLAAIEDALRRSDIAAGDQPPSSADPDLQRATPPFPHGAPELTSPYPPEIPIPLTRRVSLPPVAALVTSEDTAAAARRAAGAEPDDDDVTMMRPLSEITGTPESSPVSSPSFALPLVRSKYVPAHPPLPTIEEPAPISFPSSPPPSEDDVVSLDDSELIPMDDEGPAPSTLPREITAPGPAASPFQARSQAIQPSAFNPLEYGVPAPAAVPRDIPASEAVAAQVARPQGFRSSTLKSPILTEAAEKAFAAVSVEPPPELDDLPTGPWHGREIIAAAASARSPDSVPTMAIEAPPMSADSLPTMLMDTPHPAPAAPPTSFEPLPSHSSSPPDSPFYLAPPAEPPPTRPAVPAALASAGVRPAHRPPPPPSRHSTDSFPAQMPAPPPPPAAPESLPGDDQVRSLWSLLPPAAAPIAPAAPSTPLPAAQAPAHPDLPPESSPTVAFTSNPQSLLDRPASMPILGQRDAPRDSSPTRTGLGEIARKIIAEHDAREAQKRAQEEKEREEAEAKRQAELAEKAKAVMDVETVLLRLKTAATRDEAVALAMQGLESFAKRAAVFAVRKEGYKGWACNAAFGNENELRDVSIAIEQPSILAAAASLAVYLGPIQNNIPHAPLIAVMGHSSREALAVAVRVANRPAMILLADEFSDVKVAKRGMEELARGVSEALLRLIGHR